MVEDCGRPTRPNLFGVLLCLALLIALALAVAGGTSAAVGVTFTVDSAADGPDTNVGNGVCVAATGACTLRAAIQESNWSVGSKDRVAFALTTPPFSIAPVTELPVITDPVEIDGTTQPGFVDKPIVELRGDAIAAIGNRGLRLRTGDSLVRGLVINRFDIDMISIERPAGDAIRIAGNYLGTDITGSDAAGGERGIYIEAGSNHVIGGSIEIDRNVISGNSAQGIAIVPNPFVPSEPGRVTIRGNYIGTDATGMVGNLSPGQEGIRSINSHGPVVIGGAGPGEGNVISGNHPSPAIELHFVPTPEIVGNMIGTDRTGQTALPNTFGIEMQSVSDALIADNVISGNSGPGISLQGDGGAVVRGNKIGVDIDGLDAIPNGDGVWLVSATDVLVGGTTENARNIISGNGGSSGFGSGVHFFNFATRNTIQGNFIGVNADLQPRGNTGYGIFCCGLPSAAGLNVIGGIADGAGNVIAYNGSHGINVGANFTDTGPLASILGNSIHSNGFLGIDLPSLTSGPTPNDLSPPCLSPPGPDCDTGPNDLQNFPVIESIGSGGGQTVAATSIDSTPGTALRLEFFRNSSCNKPPASFSWFFGEGQTLVGVKDVTTDADGNWNGTVALAGDTAASEVITATATRFVEADESLAGSTSEFSECLADLAITKTDDPDPVAVGRPVTYTLDVVNNGPAPATDVRVTDTLPVGVSVTSITSSQGSCSQSGRTVTCLLDDIDRDSMARITIVLNPGTTVRPITNTARVSSDLRDPDQSDNIASATTQVVSGGTIIVEKQTLPDGSSQSFVFTTSYGPGFSLSDGQSNTSAPLAAGTYSVSETAVSGWDVSATCSDSSPPSSISLASGETVTCTFTNTQRGSVTLRKTTNGVVDPTKDIVFRLTGQGLPSAGITRSTFADQDGVLDFGTGNLIPTQIYTICETPVPAGFTSFWKLDGVIVTPYNPDASETPPEDLGTRCYDFTVTPGQARAFEVDNSRPGGDQRTIGYWKNWNRCTGGNQAAVAAKNGGAAAGFFLVEDLLPQLVGDFSVTSCQQAVKLLSKQDQNGKNKASDAAYELGAQLLAARFNLAAGAETCLPAQQAVLDGQTLLDQINFSGSGDYLGSKSKDPRRAQALSFAATLDRYNNGNLC